MIFINNSDGFSSITSVIESSSTTIFEDLAANPNTFHALRVQFPPLINFITSNLNEILEVALCMRKNTSDTVTLFCRKILSLANKNFTFSNILCNNRPFLQRLNRFLNNKTKDESGFSAFCQILLNLIKVSGGIVLLNFPEKQFLFLKMMKFIDRTYVYSFFFDVTTYGQQIVFDFMENGNFSQKLLTNCFEKNSGKVLSLLTNIVWVAQRQSNLIQTIIVPANLKAIFDSMIKDSKTAFKAFSLLLALSNKFFISNQSKEKTKNIIQSDDNAINPKYNEGCLSSIEFGKEGNNEISDEGKDLIAFIQDKIPQLVDFIVSNINNTDSSISNARKTAIDLLVLILPELVKMNSNIPNVYYELVQFLFNQLLEKPFHSILHCSCLSLFKIISRYDRNLFQKFDIRMKIINTFSLSSYHITRNKANISLVTCDNKNNLISNYENAIFLGHFYKLTGLIVKSGTFKENDTSSDSANIEIDKEWAVFLMTTYRNMREKIKTNYGGEVPFLEK